MNLSLVQSLSFQASSRGLCAFSPAPLPVVLPFSLSSPLDVVMLTGLAMSWGPCLSAFISCTRRAPPLAAGRA